MSFYDEMRLFSAFMKNLSGFLSPFESMRTSAESSDHARTSPEASLILAHALKNCPEGLFLRAGAHSLLRAHCRASGSPYDPALMALSWLIQNN